MPNSLAARVRASRLFGSLWRYTITGGLSAVIDVGGFALLAPVLPSLPAAVLAWAIAAVFNYVTSSVFAFPTPLGWGRFFAFFVSASLGMVVNVSVTMALLAFASPPAWAAKLGGVGVAFVFNFLINYLVVFARREPAEERTLSHPTS